MRVGAVLPSAGRPFGTILPMLSEFDLIARYFTRQPDPLGPVRLGVGDDCALISPAAGQQLAVSTDMLVEGRHFFAGADAFLLGHKSLAVNLSDLAAMGAKPIGFTLALALPEVNETWLAAFSRGLLALADRHGAELIGGDTTRGPLAICITVFGEVPLNLALRRDAAQVGDEIWVSGSLGDARLALAVLQNTMSVDQHVFESAARCLHQPTPRVALGLALREIAHAAIDVSDGLLGDLGHLLRRSGVGARIDADAMPIGPALSLQPQSLQRSFALNGGDDYELCFTAPVLKRQAVLAAAAACGSTVTCVGQITAGTGLVVTDHSSQPLAIAADSFDHFKTL